MMGIEEELRLIQKEMVWIENHINHIMTMFRRMNKTSDEKKPDTEFIPENQLELFDKGTTEGM